MFEEIEALLSSRFIRLVQPCLSLFGAKINLKKKKKKKKPSQ